MTKYDIYIEYYIEGKIELTFLCTLLSLIQLVANPWTVAHRGALLWSFSGKNAGVGCHALLQGPRDRTQVSRIAGEFFTY